MHPLHGHLCTPTSLNRLWTLKRIISGCHLGQPSLLDSPARQEGAFFMKQHVVKSYVAQNELMNSPMPSHCVPRLSSPQQHWLRRAIAALPLRQVLPSFATSSLLLVTFRRQNLSGIHRMLHVSAREAPYISNYGSTKNKLSFSQSPDRPSPRHWHIDQMNCLLTPFSTAFHI